MDNNPTFSLDYDSDKNVNNTSDKSPPSDASIRMSETQEEADKTKTDSESIESDSERIHRVLSNPDKYTDNSYRYFYNESLERGQGRRAICKFCLSESSVKKTRGSDILSQSEANLHFHIAQSHHRGTERRVSDHTFISRKVVCHYEDIIKEMKSALELKLDEQLECLLSRVKEHMDEQGEEVFAALKIDLRRNVLAEVEETEYRAAKRLKYTFPTDENEVARKYTDGDKSIMSSLPIPTPLVRMVRALLTG